MPDTVHRSGKSPGRGSRFRDSTMSRILVVDDNELVRRAVASMLEGSGSDVGRASGALGFYEAAGTSFWARILWTSEAIIEIKIIASTITSGT